MITLKSLAPVAALSVLGIGASGALDARRASTVENTDFDETITATTPTYDATLRTASDAGIKEFRVPIKDATIEIANGIKYQGS